jgi:hypothetical protein
VAAIGTAPPPGTVNAEQLAALWLAAGGSVADAPTAVAIALAESHGQINAHNPSGASGLWQILGAPSGVSGNVYDPATNARMAVAKYKQAGNSWSPWTTYTSGAYRQYLSQATEAVKVRTAGLGISLKDIPVVGPIASAASSAAGTVSSIADLVTSGSFWLRVLEALGGIVLLVLGLVSLAGGSPSDITAVAAKAVK